jgi:hypothetical protein
MFHDLLSESMTDFRRLDIVCLLMTLIAGSSAELCEMVSTRTACGIEHVIPASLYLILAHHTHEQHAGRFEKPHALGDLQHMQPINLALEGLYTLSLHFDLRAVRVGCTNKDGTDGLHEALAEYADFLHGFVHHQVRSKYMQAYLSRLLEFQSTRAPSMDPRPRPIETEAEQHRRLMLYCDNLQQVRRQVADQRRLGRDGTCEAAQHADAASTRGNDAIRAGRASDAFKAYSEAIVVLAGRESEPVAAWPLLLALSNRSEALQQLGRHEEVLEDVTSAVVLLDRFGSADDGVALCPAEADLERLRETLARREATSGRELAAQQERGECAEAETRRASERRQLRADRRRRACEARAARPAQEQASEMADGVAALHVAANKVAPTDASRPVHAEPLPECAICQEGSKFGALEDVCGHGHVLHPGCASLWRNQCLRMQQWDPDKHDGPGPHCPVCHRTI